MGETLKKLEELDENSSDKKISSTQPKQEKVSTEESGEKFVPKLVDQDFEVELDAKKEEYLPSFKRRDIFLNFIVAVIFTSLIPAITNKLHPFKKKNTYKTFKFVDPMIAVKKKILTIANLVKQNQNAQALIQFEQLFKMKNFKHSANTINAHAVVLRRMKKYDEALAIFNQGISNFPKSAELYNNRGVLMMETSHWNQAQKDFEKAIENKSIYPEAYLNLAVTSEQIGQWGNAQDYYQRYMYTEDAPEQMKKRVRQRLIKIQPMVFYEEKNKDRRKGVQEKER